MGLQIIIYNKLEKMEMSEVCLCDDGYPEDIQVTSFFSNPMYPVHIVGLDSHEFYKCTGKMLSFSAGTEDEHLEFKKHLALIAGYKSLEHALSSTNPGFFLEFLNFSNSEGTIGPIISHKLYQDFSDCEKIAKKYFATKMNGKFFWDLYSTWHKGFTYAKENGAIMFA